MSTQSNLRFDDLVRASNQTLEELLRSGTAPSFDTLIAHEWRGFNISLVASRLGLAKFIKGFFAIRARIEGYNIAVMQNGLTGPWVPSPDANNPKRYAFYRVTHVNPTLTDRLYPRALLLDYGASPRNPRVSVERLLRDYLVQPYADNPDLMLGKAYFAIGLWRFFSNFFIIERLRATDWMPAD